jgi:hypothetical protein
MAVAEKGIRKIAANTSANSHFIRANTTTELSVGPAKKVIHTRRNFQKRQSLTLKDTKIFLRGRTVFVLPPLRELGPKNEQMKNEVSYEQKREIHHLRVPGRHGAGQ